MKSAKRKKQNEEMKLATKMTEERNLVRKISKHSATEGLFSDLLIGILSRGQRHNVGT